MRWTLGPAIEAAAHPFHPTKVNPSMSSDHVAHLRHLDACAVSDALDRLGIDGQVATGLTPQSTQRKLVGRVVTYRLVPAGQAPKSAGPVRHLGTTAIELAQPGEVIVVEQREAKEVDVLRRIAAGERTLEVYNF